MKTIDEVLRWVNAAEADFAAVYDEYRKNREYYENYQAPDDVPKEVSYIVRNLIWDYVNRRVAKIAGGKIEPVLYGDPRADVVKELIFDILEENHFQDLMAEELANYFSVEGIAGLKVYFDPMEIGKYGLGMPRIFVLRPEELRLDPNAVSGMHTDDRARAHVKIIPLDEAHERWPERKDEIGPFSDGRFQQRNSTQQFCELWEIEFYRDFFVPHYLDPLTGEYMPFQYFDEQANDFVTPEGVEVPDDAVKIRKRVFFVTKLVNRQVVVEPPAPTGHEGFTIIPVIDIPRRTKTKWPASPVTLLTDRQDSINVNESIFLEVTKKSLKNPVFVTGATAEDIVQLKRKIAGVGEVVLVKRPDTKVSFPPSPTIPPHLLQKHQNDLEAFDQIGNTNAPDRGEPVELSGKAILALQSRSDTPLHVPKVHIEYALTQMIQRLIEIIDRKMRHPFGIQRTIDGQEQEIRFNQPVMNGQAPMDERMAVVMDTENGQMLNPLAGLKFSKVAVDIEMNALAQQNIEMSKALALRDRNAISLQDMLRAVYPRRWQEIYENVQKENQAMQLVGELMQMGPDVLQQVMQLVQMAKLAGVGNGEN